MSAAALEELAEKAEAEVAIAQRDSAIAEFKAQLARAGVRSAQSMDPRMAVRPRSGRRAERAMDLRTLGRLFQL